MEKSEELSKARLGYNRDYGPSTDLAAEPKRLKAGETVDEVGMDTSSSSSSVKGKGTLAYSICHHLRAWETNVTQSSDSIVLPEDVHMADIGKEKINVGIIRR
jgi:hypothetical protein